MHSWGNVVGNLGTQFGKVLWVIRTRALYTYFVRSLWVIINVFALLFHGLCAQIIHAFISVCSVVFPTTHSPYYSVYSFYPKKLINNTGALA